MDIVEGRQEKEEDYVFEKGWHGRARGSMGKNEGGQSYLAAWSGCAKKLDKFFWAKRGMVRQCQNSSLAGARVSTFLWSFWVVFWLRIVLRLLWEFLVD